MVTRRKRSQSATLGDLTVGVVATDLRSTTIEASETVGSVVDQLVASGGRALVAGSEVVRHDPTAAIERASSGTADAIEVLASSEWRPSAKPSAVGRRVSDVGFDDATGIWGDQRIREVVDYGAQATLDEGLALIDAPARFAEAATALVAAGAHLVVHLTGDGIPSGHPVVPVLKLSGNEETVVSLPDAIDANAAAVKPPKIVESICDVASGVETSAERHGLAPFAISRVGPSM
jgi:altronate dehydratase large subunit